MRNVGGVGQTDGGSVWWQGGSPQQEFKLLLPFSVHKLETVRRAGGKIEGASHAQASRLGRPGHFLSTQHPAAGSPTLDASHTRMFCLGAPVRSSRRSPWGSQDRTARRGLTSEAQGGGSQRGRGTGRGKNERTRGCSTWRVPSTVLYV